MFNIKNQVILRTILTQIRGKISWVTDQVNDFAY